MYHVQTQSISFLVFFFFSSRRRHTRFDCDWSSDVCSSDLFYSRYHGLRSLEQVNPPAPVPLVIGNGQDGESYGAELTAEYWLTNRWRVHAGYTGLRVHVWPNPGRTDMSRGATEAQAPDLQVPVHTSGE